MVSEKYLCKLDWCEKGLAASHAPDRVCAFLHSPANMAETAGKVQLSTPGNSKLGRIYREIVQKMY